MPEIYQSRHAGTIADLLRQRGQIGARAAQQAGDLQAQRALTSGQAWGNAIQNIGQTVSGTLADFARQKADAPRRAMEDELQRLRLAVTRGELTQQRLEQMGAEIESQATRPDGSVDRDLLTSLFQQNGIGALLPPVLREIDKREGALRQEQEGRGKQLFAATPAGPISEDALQTMNQSPEAQPHLRYNFGPGTAEGPERLETMPERRMREAEAFASEQGGVVSPTGAITLPQKPERTPLPTTASLAERAAQGDPNAIRALEILKKQRPTPASTATVDPVAIEPPTDPTSQDIMSQAGLSYNGFLALTNPTRLPRDQKTRNAAAQEVQKWARDKGMDVSTFQSQYKAFNDVLERNIQRYNNTLLAEGEIGATVANLTDDAREAGLNDVRALNAAQLWLKGELNDPKAATYAMHLNQLRNDLAMYNAASQGRSGNIFVQDLQEAERVIRDGMSAGSLQGLQTAIGKSVEKMGTILEGGVNRAQKDVWNLFGVGDKYKPVSRRPQTDQQDNQSVQVGGFTVKVKP